MPDEPIAPEEKPRAPATGKGPAQMKSRRQLEREYREAHQAAIEQGDLETIFAHNLPRSYGRELNMQLPTYEKEINQAVQNALDKNGILGLSEQVVGSYLKMLAGIIMKLRLMLASAEYGTTTGPNLQDAHIASLWDLLERATQSFMKVFRDYSAARHALAMGPQPQKGRDAGGPPPPAPKPSAPPPPAPQPSAPPEPPKSTGS